MTKESNNGIIHVLSRRSVAETIAALEDTVCSHGLNVAARIDHGGDAAKAGLKMPPAQLLIFGNPQSGTPLMLASPTAAIDLPLKALAWQDEQGRVWLSYNSPSYIQQRHQVPHELLKNIAGIKSICEEAAYLEPNQK
jgi:uncharacterized protein (DUF302 family)